MKISGLMAAAMMAFAIVAPARADDAIGQIKTLSGTVFVERAGVRGPAQLGDHVQQKDVVSTGDDGSVGMTFVDNSRMSLGPDSVLALEKFEFNSTSNEGAFDTRLDKGTLAVKSGKITQQTPEAMTVRTSAGLLGVRGTEFVVRAGDGK